MLAGQHSEWKAKYLLHRKIPDACNNYSSPRQGWVTFQSDSSRNRFLVSFYVAGMLPFLLRSFTFLSTVAWTSTEREMVTGAKAIILIFNGE
jgi:hypothetical protein